MEFPFSFMVGAPLLADPNCLVGATLLVPHGYTILSAGRDYGTHVVNFRGSSGELDCYLVEAVSFARASNAIKDLSLSEFVGNPYALLGLRVKIMAVEGLIVGYQYPYHSVMDANERSKRVKLYDTVLTVTGFGELPPPPTNKEVQEANDEEDGEDEEEASEDEDDDESESEDDEVDAPPQKKRRAPETSRIDSVAAIAGAAASAAVAAVMVAKLVSRRK